MNDILEKIHQICRICLMEQKLMFSLNHNNFNHIIDQNILTMLKTCTSIQVEINDNLPQLICSSCFQKLETAFLLKQECEKSDLILRKLLAVEDVKFDTKYHPLNYPQTDEKNLPKCNSNAESVEEAELNNIKVEDIEIKREPSNDNNFNSKDDSDNESDNDFNDDIESDTSFKNIPNPDINALKEKVQKQKPELEQISKIRYECQQCHETFHIYKLFWDHRVNMHPVFMCYICFDEFFDLAILNNHYNENHQNQSYFCNHENCTQQFDDIRQFILHKKNEHNILNYLHCTLCENKSFPNHKRWDIHVRKHLKLPFKCKMCDAKYALKREFDDHTRIHSDYYKCTECGMCFSTNSSLIRHRKTHNPEFINCDTCGKNFNEKGLLAKHIKRMHSGVQPGRQKKKKDYLCTYCGKVLHSSFTLANHIRIHTGEKRYACDKCDYRCITKTNLQQHAQVHSDLRLYKCEYCGKSFPRKAYLTIHTRFHMGERPYKCTRAGCEKGFTNSKDLRVHERTHTGIKLYNCDICSNSFTTLHYLKVHRRKHENQ